MLLANPYSKVYTCSSISSVNFVGIDKGALRNITKILLKRSKNTGVGCYNLILLGTLL